MSAAAAGGSARRARVVYSGGQLEITADDSSLNQILHEISRETGMKITGGVTDERVFGKYGPGAPAEILERLLDGTGSNMLLRETASKVPAELIRTQRLGGPSPPNPNARVDDDDDLPPTTEHPPHGPVMQEPQPAAAPVAAPMDAGGAVGSGAGAAGNSAAGTNAATVPATGAAAPGTGATNPTSPNGVQTPQQIFEQLQRLQQAQPQQPANPQ
jgi:hypothetical protein